MKEKILIGKPITEQKLRELNRSYEVHCLSPEEHTYEGLYKCIEAYDALLAIQNRVDRALLLRGKKLKVVATRAVGYDNIDIDAAKELGITITNTPKATTIPTANQAIGLMLSLLRKITENDRLLRKPGGIRQWEDPSGYGTHVEGRTLGIIGIGRIGQAVAKRAQALGMNCIYFSRTPLGQAVDLQQDLFYHSFHSLLENSDVISLHVPLNPSTRHLLNKHAFERMKRGSFIVNTARGGVIDQEALIEALADGHVAGAALDVFEEEPHIPQALLDMDQVVLAPHHGTATLAAREAMFQEAFDNIVSVLSGKGGISRVV